MIALRRIAASMLALMGMAAAAAAVMWAAGLAGLAQPVVLMTDSMAPALHAGDLLIATPLPAAELEAGDIVTVPSGGSGPLIAERVVALERASDGTWSMTTRTDASDRTALHSVDGDAWNPTLQIPLVGALVTSVWEPEVGLPLLALVGLLTAVLLFAQAPGRVDIGARARGLRP